MSSTMQELERRMCAKADRDGRAYWISRALGCSLATCRYFDQQSARSHRAWERANDALTKSRQL